MGGDVEKRMVTVIEALSMELHAKSRLVLMKRRVAEPKDACKLGFAGRRMATHYFTAAGRADSSPSNRLTFLRPMDVHVFRLPLLGTTVIMMIPN